MLTGYNQPGMQTGMIAVGIVTLLWIFALVKASHHWLVHLGLTTSVALAAIGLLLKAPTAWMMIGASMALINWDLLLLNQNTKDQKDRSFENLHLYWLFVAVGTGLITALLGQFIRLQLPFIAILGLVVLTFFCIDRVWAYYKKGKNRISNG